MESIIIKRLAIIEGDPPTYGDLSTWNTFQGLFAPGESAEPADVARALVLTHGTVYIEGSAPTGILPTDKAVIRGDTFEVDGKIAPWYDADGNYVGDVFQVVEAKT